MLHVESGAQLVGLTKSVVCAHCNNRGPHGIYQKYEKSHVLVFVPLGTNYFGIYSMCPVCEKQCTLVKFKPLFSSAHARSELICLLNEGREFTKQWFGRLDAPRKEQALKRLNNLKAYDLVRYLGLPT